MISPTLQRSPTSKACSAVRAPTPSRSAAAVASSTTIDLGSGSDKLTLGAFANTLTVSNVETLVGGALADTVTLATAISATDSIDLGCRLRQADARRLRQHRHGLERRDPDRRHGRRHHHPRSIISKGSIDLGDGTDKIVLGNFDNTVTISNVESIVGGGKNDTVTLAAELTGSSSIDLGVGKDSLTLGNFDNAGSVSNVETLTGGTALRHHHLCDADF